MTDNIISMKVPDYVKDGNMYKTKGGWDVKIVHITNDRSFCFAVHTPNTTTETIPIMHKFDGTPQEYLGIGIAPVFNSIHPATIEFKE